MNILKLGFAAVAATCIAGSAQAGVIVHDDPSEFSSIVENQGVTFNDGTVDASRSDFNNVFDGNAGTFYSLGLGGSVTLTLDPTNYSITDGTVIEITNPGSQHYPEALQVFLGNDGGGFVEIGFFLNADANGGTPGVELAAGNELGEFAKLGADPTDTDGGLFRIFDIVGSYNTIMFVDASGVSQGGEGQNPFQLATPNDADGFDIGELSVTSVPEPGTLALLGAGLAGLGLFGRRRKAA